MTVAVAGNPPAFVLLNGITSDGRPRDRGEVHDAIHDLFGLTVCPVHLCQRNAYAEAMTTGKVRKRLIRTGSGDELNGFSSSFVNL